MIYNYYFYIINFNSIETSIVDIQELFFKFNYLLGKISIRINNKRSPTCLLINSIIQPSKYSNYLVWL